MKPVVVRISDGLGNQLFQFAAGYTLASRLGAPLALDICAFSATGAPKHRNLQLLQLVGENEYDRVICEYMPAQKTRDQLRGLLTGRGRHSYRYGLEVLRSESGDDRPIAGLSRPYYLAGYQFDHRDFSEVFPAINELILHGLSRHTLNGDYREKFAFVHIRRGDYVNKPSIAARFNVLDAEYFHSAMRRFEECHGRTEWVVCSDDIDEAMSMVSSSFSCRPSSEASDLQDLHLMVSAYGGVISNSTFSFWGALLSKGHEKPIIAPSRWRLDDKPQLSLPNDWTLL